MYDFTLEREKRGKVDIFIENRGMRKDVYTYLYSLVIRDHSIVYYILLNI